MNNHYIITNGQKIIINSKKGMNPAFNPVFIPQSYESYDSNEHVREISFPAYR